MSAPHVWLREQIEDATEITAWPVEMTGNLMPPYVVYVREETARDVALTLADAINGPIAEDISAATFAVTIYADSYVQAWEVADQVAGAVHNVSGGGGDAYIQHSKVVSQRDGSAGYLDGREQPTFTVDLSVQILFEE